MRFEKSKRHGGWRYELYAERFLLPEQLVLDVFDNFVYLERRMELYKWSERLLVSEFYVVDGRKVVREAGTMSAILPKVWVAAEPKVWMVREGTVWDSVRKI